MILKDLRLKNELNILQDPNVNKEVKLSILLDLIYLRELELEDAKQICEDIGLFSKSWKEVEKAALKASYGIGL